MTATIITIQVSISMDPELESILRSLRFLVGLREKFMVGLVNQPINNITLPPFSGLPQLLEPDFCIFINAPGYCDSSHAYHLTIIITTYQYTSILQ